MKEHPKKYEMRKTKYFQSTKQQKDMVIKYLGFTWYGLLSSWNLIKKPN